MMFKRFLPLNIVVSYFIFTLCILKFGPVQFKLHNEAIFWLFILNIILAFSAGYFVGIFSCKYSSVGVFNEFSRAKFYMLVCLGLFYLLLVLANMMMVDLSLFDFGESLRRAISEPALVYSERMQLIEEGVGGGRRWFNILSFIFSWMSLIVVCYFLFHWDGMGSIDKVVALCYCAFYIAPFALSGTNSGIFKLFFFIIISLISIRLFDGKSLFSQASILIALGLIIPLLYFGNIMIERGGDVSYFELTSALADIEVSEFSKVAQSSFLYFTFLWLSYYLVQGYYGLSLIFDLDFKWTYGFGSSDFLQRQFLLLTDIDLSSDTYQGRLESIWGKAQWHSFYSQFANDVTFYGVIFFMFLIGILLARVWLSFIFFKNFFAFSLIPIYALFIIFLPANNQVFGYIDTSSYFLFVHIIWYFSKRSIK